MRRLAALIAKPGTGGGPRMTSEQIHWLHGMLASNDKARMAQAAAQLARFDSRPWLKDLAAPTLVVRGAQDTAVPAHHATMLAHDIRDARTVVINEAGHTMIWTHPDDLAQLLADWWNSIDHNEQST
jgi:pimeloyl-ACP methyl ester carboxylesterase